MFNCLTGGSAARGIEVWNVETGIVETIVDQMPAEVAYGSSITLSRMISANSNTELVFFGGVSTIYLTEVWKYNYPLNSWKMVGNIQDGRAAHVTIPVKGMECP
jgi:hypothetical protein